MQNDLITIIIPVYNGADYIGDCVEGIKSQTYTNYEVFFINDGSIDGSDKILTEYCQNNPNFFLINIKNCGAGLARNYGIDHARGKYICFIDVDDKIAPHYLQKLHDLITTLSADVACAEYVKNKKTDFEVLSDETKILTGQQAVDDLLSMKIKNGPAVKIYTREVIGNMRMPNYCVAEDLFFNYWVFKNAQRVIVNDSILYSYTVGNNSLSTREFSPQRMDSIEAVNKINENEHSFYSILRLFMEAYFIIEKIILAKGEDKFSQEYRIAKETLTLYRETVVNDKRTPARQKLVARLLKFGPKFTVNIMTMKQKAQKLSFDDIIKGDEKTGESDEDS